MLMFAFIGMLVGMLIFHYLNERLFELLLAIFITACGVYIVTSHDNPRFKKSTLHSLDFTAGMSQQMFGISGPIAMTRIIGSHSDKTVIRNYALAFFLSLNIVRALSYIVVEINSTGWTLFNPQILKAMVIAAPILLITLLVSNQMHFKVRQESFKKILSWVILIGGLYMLIGWFSQ